MVDIRTLPVLPLRDIVVFPHMVVPLFVGRDKSVRALEEVMRGDKQILLATQKNSTDDDPAPEAIYDIGVIATVLQLLKLPDGTVKVLVEGSTRASIVRFTDQSSYYEAEVMATADESGAAQVAAFDKASEQLEEIVAMVCLPQHSASASDSWALWLDLWAQSARNPEVAAVRKEFDEHWRTTLSDIVLKGQQQQEFTHVDSREFAIIFSALLDGLAIQIALDDPVVTNQEAFEISMRFASQSLGFSWNASPARHSSI